MQNGWKKSVWYNSRQKRSLLRLWNHPFKKHPKIYIFPWFLSKSADFSILCFNGKIDQWPFFQLFFLGNIGQENVFYDILEKKRLSTLLKNKKFKKSKNWHFSKDVNPWFWSKNGHFSYFLFSGNKGQENVIYDILHQKNAFLGYKNKKNSKSQKIDIFPKTLTHGFDPKMAIFPTFFFQEIKARKMSFTIFYNKKTPF